MPADGSAAGASSDEDERRRGIVNAATRLGDSREDNAWCHAVPRAEPRAASPEDDA